ncbi:UNVERIFIED_CONTAM: hypothetical protein FKN15_006170 [Acipenser sinensis]
MQHPNKGRVLEQHKNLSETYGNVFTFHMGPKKYVVLTGYEAVKEALVTQADDFSERGQTHTTNTSSRGGNGKPFDPQIIINSAVSNIICSIMLGDRFDYSDTQFLNLQRIVNENVRLSVSPKTQLYNMFPFLGFFLSDHKKVQTNGTMFQGYFRNTYKDRKDSVDSNDLRSFIDTFISRQREEGTPVIPLLSSVLSDKTQWETPHQFNPNHFLDVQGKFVKRDAFMPFSAGQCVREEQGPGQRVCLGETLAKMELFLFFTMLLQKFHFRPPQEVSPEQLDLTPTPGLTSGPQPFQLCALSH